MQHPALPLLDADRSLDFGEWEGTKASVWCHHHPWRWVLGLILLAPAHAHSPLLVTERPTATWHTGNPEATNPSIHPFNSQSINQPLTALINQ